ncbi:MAG: histidine phosphatase family protein [Acidobacteriota bacterium]
MRTLIVVRHGETEWNSEKRIQGSVNVPLSPKGIGQAEALAETMAREAWRFDRVYTSDLDRSRTTAQILADRLEIPVLVTSPLLRELHCGLWEGRAIEELRTREPEAYASWLDDPEWAIPGGESVSELYGRVVTFFKEQKATLEGCRDVLLVAHGLANRMILAALMKIEPQRARYFIQDNTAINVFSWHSNGRIYCEGWNATCHLEQESEDV